MRSTLVLQNKMGPDVQPNSIANLLSATCIVLDFSWILYKDRLGNGTRKLKVTCATAVNTYILLFCWYYMHIRALYICYLRGQTLTPCASWKTENYLQCEVLIAYFVNFAGNMSDRIWKKVLIQEKICIYFILSMC